MLIAFEGIDGSGKTTHSHLLSEYLHRSGYNVYHTQEPWCTYVDDVSPEAAALGYAYDRALHVAAIQPLLAKTIVITDRYTLSSLAYQSALGADMDWVHQINSQFPRPNLVLYLDIPPEDAVVRVNKRGNTDELYNHLELQKKVHTAYDEAIARYRMGRVVRLDASKDKELLAMQVREIIEGML